MGLNLNGQTPATSPPGLPSSASASPNLTILPAPGPGPDHGQPPSLTSGKGKFAVRPFTPVKRAKDSAEPEGSTGAAGDSGTPAKRIACIECRQQKVRCDAHEQFPGSCTRCTKKGLKCLLKPDFKRTYKRRRLVEVEEEMERLRQSMEAQESEKRRIVSGSLLDLSNSTFKFHIPLAVPGAQEPEPKYPDLPTPAQARDKAVHAVETPSSVDSGQVEHFNTPPGAGSSGSAQYQRHRPGAATASGHVELDLSVLECTEKTMDGVTLGPDTIANLYKEFVFKYHPFLPVVDVSRGPEKIYELCPSLFWTIMAIASRRYDKDGELMMQLTPVLKSCLSEITISPINRFAPKSSSGPILNVASAYTVQAFLIYTMWPSITSTLSADSSWSTAGIAMYSGIRVGLHCPGYARDFGRIKADNPIYPKVTEQIRTWIACNIVSQTVATVYGFPAFTSFDASVLSACEPDSGIDVPDAIKQLMLIQHLEEEIAKTLNANPKDPLGLSELSERLSLIQILSRKMDELEIRLGEMDDCRKFVLLGARVHLLTYYFLDNGGYTELQLQKGMIHAYNSALALLEHGERAYRRDRSFFRYMPGIYAQILWQSSCIICKVYHSPFAQFVDSNAGRQMYMSCVSLISKASILKHDMMYRAAEIMQQVWRLFGALARRNGGHEFPRIVIRTRMSASVFFDVLWTMREEIGIRSVAPAVLDQRNPADADDDDDMDGGVVVGGGSGSAHSPEGSPVPTSSSAPVPALGPSQPFRFKEETEPMDANSLVHATLSRLPFDPQPIIPGRGGRGRGGRGGSRGRTATPASRASAVGEPLIASDSQPLFIDPPTPSAFDVPTAPAAPTVQAATSQSVVNGVDFFTWEADTIWRDVDMLMSDFGFREDEAPSLDFLYGPGTNPNFSNHSVNNGAGGQPPAKDEVMGPQRETKRF